MERAFDLWSFDDVRAHASDILERGKIGSMPCDLARGRPSECRSFNVRMTGVWPREIGFDHGDLHKTGTVGARPRVGQSDPSNCRMSLVRFRAVTALRGG